MQSEDVKTIMPSKKQTIKINPWKLFLAVLSKLPKGALPAKVLRVVDKQVDKASDEARKARRDMVDRIRRSGSSMLILAVLGLSCAGCVSAKMLEKEGHDLSFWQKVRLGYFDCLIFADDVMDYEVEIEE